MKQGVNEDGMDYIFAWSGFSRELYIGDSAVSVRCDCQHLHGMVLFIIYHNTRKHDLIGSPSRVFLFASGTENFANAGVNRGGVALELACHL
jgi:hypothetical protein